MKKIIATVTCEVKPSFSSWKSIEVRRICEVLEEKGECVKVKFNSGLGFDIDIERWIPKKDILGVIE